MLTISERVCRRIRPSRLSLPTTAISMPRTPTTHRACGRLKNEASWQDGFFLAMNGTSMFLQGLVRSYPGQHDSGKSRVPGGAPPDFGTWSHKGGRGGKPENLGYAFPPLWVG